MTKTRHDLIRTLALTGVRFNKKDSTKRLTRVLQKRLIDLWFGAL